jgi:hypothetical protein
MTLPPSSGAASEARLMNAKRALDDDPHGRARAARTTPSTAVPARLLTRKRTAVQLLPRPPLFSLVSALSAPSGQRSSHTAAALRPQSAPRCTRWALQSGTTRDQHQLNDHRAWSPPPGPAPCQASRRHPALDAPAGACEHLLLPCSPANRPAPGAGPAPLVDQAASAAPQPVRMPSGGPGLPSTLVRATQCQRSAIPSRQAGFGQR